MVIKNWGDLSIHIRPPETITNGFMIREDEIKELFGLVDTMGGSVMVKARIKKILTDVVERSK